MENQVEKLPKFAVLQLSGCAGCEVSLLNATEWIDRYQLVYMPLVISTHHVPADIEVLLVSGGVRNDDDAYNLQRAASHVDRVIAVGTCAISGGVSNLGDRDDVRELFLSQSSRYHLPRLLPNRTRWILSWMWTCTCLAALPHPSFSWGHCWTQKDTKPAASFVENAGGRN